MFTVALLLVPRTVRRAGAEREHALLDALAHAIEARHDRHRRRGLSGGNLDQSGHPLEIHAMQRHHAIAVGAGEGVIDRERLARVTAARNEEGAGVRHGTRSAQIDFRGSRVTHGHAHGLQVVIVNARRAGCGQRIEDVGRVRAQRENHRAERLGTRVVHRRDFPPARRTRRMESSRCRSER